jgi:homoserine dehydrogenase
MATLERLPRKEAWTDYRNQFDENFYKYIMAVLDYLDENFNQGEVKDPTTLEFMLEELCAYYESFATWIARRQAEIDELKTELNVEKAELFERYKGQGLVVDLCKAKITMETAAAEQTVNELKKGRAMVEALKKSLAHYIDSTRSQFSYEKQQHQYRAPSGGQQ